MSDTPQYPSNIGRWDSYYRGMTREQTGQFGDDVTYKRGYAWLQKCALIEDWGAGRGFFRTLCGPKQYRGLDCSHTPHADEIVDFVTYRSSVPGIFMRHVLEHNHGWQVILRNALDSFTERMALVIFTPFVEETRVNAFWEETQSPDYFFAKRDIEAVIGDIKHHVEGPIRTQTMYDYEHVFYLEK